MRVLQSKYTWIIIFILFFALSIDLWRWNQEVALGFWGFPNWMTYFVLLSLLLTVAIAVFSQTYWKE